MIFAGHATGNGRYGPIMCDIDHGYGRISAGYTAMYETLPTGRIDRQA
jgi:hypothetical protein